MSALTMAWGMALGMAWGRMGMGWAWRRGMVSCMGMGVA